MKLFIFIQSLFSFSAPVDIDIRFNGEEQRKLVEVKVDRDRREKFPLYFDGETVAGRVSNFFSLFFIIKPIFLKKLI